MRLAIAILRYDEMDGTSNNMQSSCRIASRLRRHESTEIRCDPATGRGSTAAHSGDRARDPMFFSRYRKALLDRRIGPYIRRGPTNAVRAAAADCGHPPCIAAGIPSATPKPLFLPPKKTWHGSCSFIFVESHVGAPIQLLLLNSPNPF